MHSLRKCLISEQLTCLQRGKALPGRGFLGPGLTGPLLLGGVQWYSLPTSMEVRACDISGLIEASVRDLSSVPYLCLRSLGKLGWISFNNVSTTGFSNVGESSLSSCSESPWWLRPLVQRSESSTKAISYRSPRRLPASSFILEKSIKWAPVGWKPKCCLIVCQINFREVEVLTKVLLEIIGQ